MKALSVTIPHEVSKSILVCNNANDLCLKGAELGIILGNILGHDFCSGIIVSLDPLLQDRQRDKKRAETFLDIFGEKLKIIPRTRSNRLSIFFYFYFKSTTAVQTSMEACKCHVPKVLLYHIRSVYMVTR